MLKSLLNEVVKNLRRRPTEVPKSVDAMAPTNSLFATGTPEQRRGLIDDLKKSLSDSATGLSGWIRLGDWLLATARFQEAEAAYRRALHISPSQPKAQEGLGLTLLHLRRFEESYLHLETANRLEPSSAEILIHWGLVDLELGNLSKAASKFERAIERDPRSSHAWHNLGITAVKQGQIDRGIHHFRKAIELHPEHGLAYSNLALAYRQADRLQLAINTARRATELKLGNARVWVVLGDLLINAGEFAQAAQAFQRAQSIDPASPESFVGQGKLFAATGEHMLARNAFDRALALAPRNADAQGGLAQLQLLLGEWSTGWDFYEARRRTESAPVRNMPYREWSGPGEAAQGKILVHVEQGLGDILLFTSCLPDLLALNTSVVLEAPPRLHGLLSRSFSQAEVVMHDPAVADPLWLDTLSGIECHIPIGSLPRFFRRSHEAFARGQDAYLQADPAKVASWRQKLSQLPQPHIGLAWRGGLAATARAQRSMNLQILATAMQPLGGTLVCLQYGDVADELRKLEAETGISIHDGLSGFGDLDDMAALTAALDGVITVCSTQAHLTGALGVRGIVLVPFNPNWRYGASGDRSPWYPSLQLLRQTQLGAWEDVLKQATESAQTLFRAPKVLSQS